MKATRMLRSLPLGEFETSSWTPVIRRRANVARRAPALSSRNRHPAVDLAARLLHALQGGVR